MDSVRIPGFTAEASLHNASGPYSIAGNPTDVAGQPGSPTTARQ